MAVAVTFKGLASIEGVAGGVSLNVIVWLMQTGRFNDNFEEEVIKDQHGFDTAWLARNQHTMADLGMKIVGASFATITNQTWPLTPYATVTLTGFVLSSINGTYQYITGADTNFNFDKVAEATFKLRKYADVVQAALSVANPS